ncbi:MAG: YbaB/EbfC family nucleoid-associated protein [Armatimonadetes bacterium]|nr:YbaB/EbfC family nucleoid-associated protein [Armatimonadota bacterium]NIM22947.1 YbaB/EbfC family nucleoid-associated protein [Armatimonadota bacterium]NIM66818.1 YbaB/EbfC family nucleoid-associated protein [Armatimonadota bacterium]NIM75359.1 YbaB/EbfC family nucleoid-associated protein [Armatimonadota bacterium]NIN05006.1 YbaB/EbfC family nucleoid-associated protein [Armatimonadota bacterium]
MAMFGGMEQLLGPMIEKFKRDLEKAKQELSEEKVEATAGGGMVSAQANGEGALLEVEIAAEALQDADAEMLGDMVVAAVREVQDKAKQLKVEKFSGLFGGMEAMGLDVSSLF